MTAQARVYGKRILLAEDDPEARESINLLLRIDRHEVIEAANGREALALFTQGRFDLVIVDYAMPEMLGNELALNIGSPSSRSANSHGDGLISKNWSIPTSP